MAKYLIGVDTGGTYTDVCVIDKEGYLTIGKSPTTPGQLEKGVIDALENAAQPCRLPSGTCSPMRFPSARGPRSGPMP